jgi:hypothetical protein
MKDEEGAEFLLDKSQRVPDFTNRTEQGLEKLISSYAIEYLAVSLGLI